MERKSRSGARSTEKKGLPVKKEFKPAKEPGKGYPKSDSGKRVEKSGPEKPRSKSGKREENTGSERKYVRQDARPSASRGYSTERRSKATDHTESTENRPQRPATFKKEGYRSAKAGKPFDSKSKAKPRTDSGIPGEKLVRLNKYIANSGICSRREADQLILAGAVMVNGKIVTELGTKISPSDKVQYDNQTIRNERHVYVLLNKPKGYITTTDDPFDRKTVMTLVANACKERIYPVGRLDRNTTGLLLLTNDGEIAKKLTHPKHMVKKVYHVELDKALSKSDMIKIADGIELDDGFAKIDEIAYAGEGSSKKEVGVELHSGRNRIVRRLFEAVGYEVVKLDRLVFAGLTKKDLPRGHWRFLTELEVNYLKMLR
jgi:23S rRNA pseudouridine2605 synthase